MLASMLAFAEARLGRATPDEPRRGIGKQPADHQHQDAHDQVGDPQQEGAQHAGDRGQAQRIESDDERDQPDEPFDDERDEAGSIGLDPHPGNEAGQAGTVRETVEIHPPEQAPYQPGDEVGEEPADDQDQQEADDPRNGGKKQRQCGGNGCEGGLAPARDLVHCRVLLAQPSRR
jgi:hypothetical protein